MTRTAWHRVATVIVTVAVATIAQADDPSPPAAIGAVIFPHQLHTEDLEIECSECHHETNADVLSFPHEDYLEDFWIDCRVCHRTSGAAAATARDCTNCHHPAPANVADQTLSAKVVIHKRCWNCHEVGSGVKASRTCGDCHSRATPPAEEGMGKGDGS